VTLHRDQLLARLHQIIHPTVYLETGVQLGGSLSLAGGAHLAIGVDPNPLIQESGNQVIYAQDSDSYFAAHPRQNHQIIDFGYVDGDHTFEQAMRDFLNIQARGSYKTIVAFDDVLPYNQTVGSREPVPGDWAGDVWRVYDALKLNQPELILVLVDVVPTGVLLVWNLDPFAGPKASVFDAVHPFSGPVPDDVINRTYAVDANEALDLVQQKVGH